MWLYVPSIPCPSVAEWEDLNSDSKSLSAVEYAPFVTLSAKPTPRPFSWRGWRTRPWIRLLYGTTSAPSMASRGVESWIASLQATRASHSPALASDSGNSTSGISGMTLPELSGRFPRHLYSSKTLQEQLSFELDASVNWRAWATELRRDYSARRKWAHHIRGSGYSCWGQTPRPFDARGFHKGEKDNGSLTELVVNWATPDLAPDAPNKGANVKCREASLGPQAKNWTSPSVSDLFTDRLQSSQQSDGSKHSVNLSQEIQNWPTPASRDTKGDYSDEAMIRKDGKSRLDLLPNVASRFSLQDQPTTKSGEKSSNNTRKLNPLFVEWLMGWPIGMTGFEPVGTEWSHKLRLSRLLLFGGD
jgi:hypothetical protein